jgi:hypothetical protein
LLVLLLFCCPALQMLQLALPTGTKTLAITDSAMSEKVWLFGDGTPMDEVSRLAFKMLHDSEDEEEAHSAATAEQKPKAVLAKNADLKAAVTAAAKSEEATAQAAKEAAAAQVAEAAAHAANTAASRKPKESIKN